MEQHFLIQYWVLSFTKAIKYLSFMYGGDWRGEQQRNGARINICDGEDMEAEDRALEVEEGTKGFGEDVKRNSTSDNEDIMILTRKT